MKRVKMKGVGIKKTNPKGFFEIKQLLAFKLLLIFLLVLIFLIILYIFIYESKEKKFVGELGTLCISCPENTIRLTVLNYTLFSDSVIYININWSTGNFNGSDFKSILVDFDMIAGANCNYTISSDLLNFGENKTYIVSNFNPGCPELGFSNVTNVFAYAEVDIHLTQKSSIPSLNFYKDDSRSNLIYLNNYFYALNEINYSIVETPGNSQIEVVVDNFTKNLSISVLDGTWFGTQQFNLTASTEEGESLTTVFSLIVIDGTRLVLNSDPEFDEEDCGNFSWNKDTNKTIDMDSCWSDENGDRLDYSYSELNRYKENISILNLSGNRLVFVPDLGFNGSAYLNFYANDSHITVSNRVYLYVLGNSTVRTNSTNASLPTPALSDPLINKLEIKSSLPVESKVSFFINESKVFSIIAENYELIEWYVDRVLVKEGVLSYLFEGKNLGVYSIEVRVIKGDIVEKKVWEVSIEEDEQIKENFLGVNVGQVVFYSIIVVLIIIIFLIIWLLIAEIRRRSRKMNLGFGISVVPNRGGFNESSKQFNIPKD